MSTYTLPLPATMRDRLRDALPRYGGGQAVIMVTPRSRDERRCPAYDAHHYEVHAYYTTLSADALPALEQALRETPGVYATTQVCPVPGTAAAENTFSNPDWPPALGVARRDRHRLRPQVIALIKDPV